MEAFFIKTHITTTFGGGYVMMAIHNAGRKKKMANWKKVVHIVYQCSYHLVWTTKYRHRILQEAIKA
jgi:hypothetical protein